MMVSKRRGRPGDDGEMGPTRSVRLLVVEHDTAERRKLCQLAAAAGFAPSEASSLAQLAGWLAHGEASGAGCVLLAMRLPDGDAHAAIAACQAAAARPPVLLLRDDEDAEALLAAWSAGAAGFVFRRLLSPETLRVAVARATGARAPATTSGSVAAPSPFRALQLACHDLRNPLSAMTINANLLLREPNLDEQRRMKIANRIVSSANRMSRMIDELAEYASTARGEPIQVRPTDTDLGTIAEEAMREARAANPGRALVLEQHGDLRGHWDPERLRQLMHNLIGSSLKRGRREATVVVGCAEVLSPPEVRVGLEFRLPKDGLGTMDRPGYGSPGQATEEEDVRLFVAARIVDAHHGALLVGGPDPVGPRLMVTLPKRALATARPAVGN